MVESGSIGTSEGTAVLGIEQTWPPAGTACGPMVNLRGVLSCLEDSLLRNDRYSLKFPRGKIRSVMSEVLLVHIHTV